MTGKRGASWAAWAFGSVALAGWLGAKLAGGDRTAFVPGTTSDGHHQIELACNACHGEAFTDRDAMQAKCEGCHAAGLNAARDAHPKSKFTDPRNADRAALLDATYCITCHVEHEPARTLAAGVTLPTDFCALCHRDVGVERPSHAELGFDTCASSGCHNFHDNRALYEDFLLKNADAPALRAHAALPERNLAEIAALIESYPRDRFPLAPLSAAEHDAPAREAPADAVADWAASAHAANGVNCRACHEDAVSGEWLARPDHTSCTACHSSEVDGFLLGRHGMRLNAAANGVALGAMRPGLARLPMHAAAADRELGCSSCHAPHRYDTVSAATRACLGCHADEHSLAFEEAPHAANGVTCATCHMPRTPISRDFGAYTHVLVEHNQSDNLRPNDKMLRPVCMHCHGLGFSIDALADAELVRRNFAGEPAVHVRSIDLAVERRRAIERERQAQRAERDLSPSVQPAP